MKVSVGVRLAVLGEVGVIAAGLVAAAAQSASSRRSGFEARICFANGVRTHSISRWMGGTLINSVETSQNGALCRTIESRSGPSGMFSTVKGPGGSGGHRGDHL